MSKDDMKERKVISWIFLAIALSSQKELASDKNISAVANGINQTVPTPNEFKLSISWLLRNELIVKENSKYRLTKKGLINYNFASLNTNLVYEVWKNIERQFLNMH